MKVPGGPRESHCLSPRAPFRESESESELPFGASYTLFSLAVVPSDHGWEELTRWG